MTSRTVGLWVGGWNELLSYVKWLFFDARLMKHFLGVESNPGLLTCLQEMICAPDLWIWHQIEKTMLFGAQRRGRVKIWVSKILVNSPI
jgi:hypothetical protein